MRFIIYGAGGVGGCIGARLHQAGHSVVLIARGAHGQALRESGLRLLAPDGDFLLRLPVVGHPRAIQFQPDDMVLLTVKSQHTVAALDDLRAVAPPTIGVVCAQNGVANERMALRRFARVYAMVVNLPAVHLVPGEVVTHAEGRGGILDAGCFPDGVDEPVQALTRALTAAGFAAAADPHVMRRKYAKLLMNLGNALQAATVPAEGDGEGTHDGEEQARAAVLRQLRREALACYQAAGIDCATRDQERARQDGVYRMVDLPGRPRQGGSSWQSLSRGAGNIETDFLNGEIVLLGRLHGVPVAANELVQELAQRMVIERLPVGHFTAGEVLLLVEQRLGHVLAGA